jgi:hypothetical protein
MYCSVTSASLADVVRRLSEARWGDLSAIVWAYGTEEEVCSVVRFRFSFVSIRGLVICVHLRLRFVFFASIRVRSRFEIRFSLARCF